jgi:threonine/homoserine/homoserine lactone efflux protein
MSALFEGIALGLTLSLIFGFGPALFALIQTSMHRGFWSGALLAFGIFLSDLLLVGLGFFGAVKIFYNSQNQYLFGILGGIVLIIFGIVTFTRRVKIDQQTGKEEEPESTPGPVTFILKGFFINITNPFVWIFWMGVVVGFTANYKESLLSLLIFFAAALGTIFTFDILKCFSAYKIKKYLQPNYITWINRVAGVGIVLFGVYLILRTVFGLGGTVL